MAQYAVRKGLRQWIALYEKDLPSGLAFALYDAGAGRFMLVADERLDHERFHFLVNYLHYPEGGGHEARVEGFTTATDRKLYPSGWIGKRVMVHVPQDDKEGDNVHAVTSDGVEMKFDFGGRVQEVRTGKRFNEPTYHVQGMEPLEVFMTKAGGSVMQEDASDEGASHLVPTVCTHLGTGAGGLKVRPHTSPWQRHGFGCTHVQWRAEGPIQRPHAPCTGPSARSTSVPSQDPWRCHGLICHGPLAL